MKDLEDSFGRQNFFHLLSRAATNASKAAHLYRDLVELDDDPRARSAAIREREQEGDVLTHDIFRALARRVVLPIDRADIHQLAERMDDVIDAIEAAADQFVLFRIDQPTPQAGDQAQALVESCDVVAEAVGLLPAYSSILTMLPRIHALEKEGHEIFRRAIGHLYEGPYEPLYILKWKEIYNEVESAIDSCAAIADLLEAVVLKQG